MNDGTQSEHPLDSKVGTSLHSEFVGMLFALATAQVAVESADLVNHKFFVSKSTLEILPAYSHLFLAMTIIGSSWVGWKSSTSSMSKIENIFSIDCLELLIDFFLVVCYFIIVRSVESISLFGNFEPSAKPEVFWTTVILITYFFWDLLTKLIKNVEHDTNRDDSLNHQNNLTANKIKATNPLNKIWFWITTRDLATFLSRGWASFTCAILSLIAYSLLPTSTTEPMTIVIIDLTLFVLILTFRAMKLEDFKQLSNKQHALWIILLGSFLCLMLILVIMNTSPHSNSFFD
ncbi:hypothetical protein [Gimesia aquarii]|uniref:Uncharacterized protein n=1 Tax=Gimesia aquarii TaxID=2527964 RepID=A0A517WU51_9PLAN|nr:hypothetical protein [Gimesia aquarii]QDU08774.1 hypothetical protein V202x_21440 [Gimesia aquarii]